ncbi:hypothetical protein C8R43DRAFT_1008931 [Mycena crocata]|nr:hypothetical protein C8R43DRAFT_1008931 [Mycena crocata]
MTSDGHFFPPILSLPTELSWSILRLATPWAYISPPFAQKPAPVIDTVLRDKINIVLVCRYWRAIATEFLYEEVAVDSGLKTWDLVQLLKPSDSSPGYGKYVRCIKTLQLKFVGTEYCDIRDLLPFCPNLEIICKADASKSFWKDHQMSALSSLRSIFWGHGRADSQATTFHGTFLLKILALCPSVDFLSIPSSFRSFHYLRLAVEQNLSAGKHITHLELQPEVGMQLLPLDIWQRLTAFLPNLRQIGHHVGRPALPLSVVPNSGLMVFRLYVSNLLPPSENILRGAAPELSALAGDGFPDLQRVELHGNWRSVANVPAFRAIEQDLLASGRSLVFADGPPVQRMQLDSSA